MAGHRYVGASRDPVRWLTNIPASDVNFKATLKTATVDEVRQALAWCEANPAGNATRIRALRGRLRRLEREARAS